MACPKSNLNHRVSNISDCLIPEFCHKQSLSEEMRKARDVLVVVCAAQVTGICGRQG